MGCTAKATGANGSWFFHVNREEIPSWVEDGISFKLVDGEAFGYKSPVMVHSKLYMIEIVSSHQKTLKIGSQLYGESGLYILEGRVETEGNEYGPGQLLVATDSKLCEFTMQANSKIYIFGGEPFPEQL